MKAHWAGGEFVFQRANLGCEVFPVPGGLAIWGDGGEWQVVGVITPLSSFGPGEQKIPGLAEERTERGPGVPSWFVSAVSQRRPGQMFHPSFYPYDY
jgi:hypothetical protein